MSSNKETPPKTQSEIKPFVFKRGRSMKDIEKKPEGQGDVQDQEEAKQLREQIASMEKDLEALNVDLKLHKAMEKSLKSRIDSYNDMLKMLVAGDKSSIVFTNAMTLLKKMFQPLKEEVQNESAFMQMED